MNVADAETLRNGRDRQAPDPTIQVSSFVPASKRRRAPRFQPADYVVIRGKCLLRFERFPAAVEFGNIRGSGYDRFRFKGYEFSYQLRHADTALGGALCQCRGRC